MTASQIEAAEIQEGICVKLRPHLVIDSLPLPREYFTIVESFWRAADIISGVVRIPPKTNVVFATSPFILDMPTGKLTYETRPNVINACLNGIVFLDCNKMAQLSPALQIACILEELVHVLLNVTDEDLVTQVVGWLHDDIDIVDGKYTQKKV